MTEYRMYGVTLDEGRIAFQIVVGKGARLEPVVVTRDEAWRLSEQLSAALRRSESAS